LHLPVLKTSKFTDAQIAQIAAAKADWAFVVAFGAMIPKPALEILPWWNLHFSLLPMWRGATPLQHSILNGSRSGLTIFEIDRGLDTGLVLGQREIPVGTNETTGEALSRFVGIGVQLHDEITGSAITHSPQLGEPSYAPKLSRVDAKLDFNLDADSIHRAIMAFNPEPMAWCELDGQPLRIMRSKSLGRSDWTGSDYSAGRVSRSGDRILVECDGGTMLELVEVQPAGKNPMAAGDWYRGLNREVILV
jgi:methionyl-tRNA formyltransferase